MKKLLFIYNADSGLFNTLTDIAHKIFSPKTYSCQLCQITHGNLSMRDNWKQFMSEISIPVEYYHRDEYEKMKNDDSHLYPKVDYPCVLLEDREIVSEFISSEGISHAKDVAELANIINNKLGEITQQ